MKLIFLFLFSFSALSSQKILSDYKNRVSSDFEISSFFKPSVSFWFDIYTKHNFSSVVIHDKKFHSIVYGVTKNESKFKKDLIRKINNLKSYPKLKKKLSKHYLITSKSIKTIIRNIRGQRGQKDMIRAGLKRYSNYSYFLEKTIKRFKLPKELLAISFLESSFNPKAHSKARAAGAWQFMPLIASYFLPRRDRYIDYRFNVIFSSLGAFHLLKQNRQILKTYDLAVTAYNSGTKNLIKARRKYKKKTSLEYIIKNHKGRNFGFASKNFYSEFLALTRVLAYKNELFKKLPSSKKRDYYLYMTKCSFNTKHILYPKLNSHIFSFKRRYKKRTLFISRAKFDSKNFKRISHRDILRTYPKNFLKKKKFNCL